jgi:N-acyl homoserine lactone hydrolase
VFARGPITLNRVIPIRASTFEYPDGPRLGERGVVMAFAIRRGGRCILVDTGIRTGHPAIDARFKPAGDPLAALLAEHDIDVADVEVVVNSHLHFDHCGQNALFPRIPIYVQEREWLAAESPDYTVPTWLTFAGATYRRVDGDHDLGDGIRIVATPGHTPGHQSVVVELPEEVVVIAGQACYSPGEWSGKETDMDGAETAWDPVLYARSLERLRGLRPDKVLFGHATEPWTSDQLA